MRFEWNEGKAATNEEKHRLSFELAKRFEIVTAMIQEDTRRDYGERRWVAVGLVGPRVLAICFTERGNKVRVISLRRANRKEIRSYVESL